MHTLNYNPLSQSVTWREAIEFKKRQGSSPVGIYIALIVLSMVAALLGLASYQDDQLRISVLVLALLVAGAAWLVYKANYESLKRSLLLELFAKQNGFSYVERSVAHEDGNIFQIGTPQGTRRSVYGTYHGRPFWTGTYTYVVGSGKRRQAVRIGVLSITLPRSVPHVILDGRQNFVQAAAGVDRSQRLQLEGDFNTYFTVYCPKGYERDVLYFLTPELMQALVDVDDSFDAELIGDKLYFYTRKEIRPDAHQLEGLFALINSVGGEVVENTARYQDWRIDKLNGTVAPQGLRLKQSIWPLIITVLGILIALLLQVFKLSRSQ